MAQTKNKNKQASKQTNQPTQTTSLIAESLGLQELGAARSILLKTWDDAISPRSSRSTIPRFGSATNQVIEKRQ